MDEALHPFVDRIITVTSYHMEFGHKPIHVSADGQPRARCPVCRQGLSVVAGRTENNVGHFAHLPNAGFCPTKSRAGAPYLDLYPTTPDAEATKHLKAAVLNNARRHYAELARVVPCLSLDELDILLGRAREMRIWEYRGLVECQVPYVLPLLADFPPWTSATNREGQRSRKMWFRYWYSSSVRAISDLWIQPPATTTLWVGYYRPPKRQSGVPSNGDLIKVKEVQRNLSFLGGKEDAHCPSRSEKLLQVVERIFSRHLE